MSIKRPPPTTWEELRMPQRHLMRVLATEVYDPDDPHELAKVAWPERDHTKIHTLSKRYLTEWGISQQVRYLRWYDFVEHTGPIVLTPLGRKVYDERWDREIDRLLNLRDVLSNQWGWCLMDDACESEATNEQLAVAFTEWLDTQERTYYLSRAWEQLAWNTQHDVGAHT